MNTRLVLWGEIGTDRKALIALYLQEETAKIHIYAFPKEQVTKELQDSLFVEWKNGGDYPFPDDAIHWEVDANSDTILPEDVKVERPEIILQSQHKWSKKLMSSRINQLLSDETALLEEKASSLGEYDQSLWDKAKAQWEKIASYQKKNEITWEQTTALKEKINGVFDALKAVKRISTEHEDQANAVLLKQFQKRIGELQAKLIYSDQWKFIFDELKKIQQELKDAPLRWNHKRAIYNNVNSIFDDLRKYRSTEILNKTKSRITQLMKILDGLKDSIARDQENFNMQVEKMQHYTRGKLSADEIKSRFSYIFDRIKEKENKADGISQTITQLKKEIEKEKKQLEEREQARLKREQEQTEGKEEKTEEGNVPEESTEAENKQKRKRKPRAEHTEGEPATAEPTADAEQILAQNNATLEHRIEIKPATPHSLETENEQDAVDREIADATDNAVINPD